MRVLLVASPLALALAFQSASNDWPQFLGPNRDGVYHGRPLAES